MEYVVILSPGKKIRNIRKEFKIRQHEITGGEITRNLISIIENDKASLTSHVADILAENINKICEKKGVDFRTSPEYLMESEETQANRMADKFIEYLDKCWDKLLDDFDTTIEKIEIFLVKYDIFEKKVMIYQKIGDIYTKNHDFYKAYTYYIKAYENSSRLSNESCFLKLIEKIGGCCVSLKKYKEALDFNNFALMYKESIPRNIHYALLFNNILIYKNTGSFDKALSSIEYIENNLCDLIHNKFDLFTLKANCLKQKKSYTDALEIHKYIFNMFTSDNVEQKLIAACNTLEIYMTMNDLKNLKYWLNKSSSLIAEYEILPVRVYSPSIYYDLGISYKTVHNTEMAEMYLLKSIKAGEKYNNKEAILNSMNELFDTYAAENNMPSLDNLKNKLLELISMNFISSNNVLILKFINYYNTVGDSDSIAGLVNFVLKECK